MRYAETMCRSLLVLLATMGTARAAPPTGYQCSPGKVQINVGCTCPAKFTPKRDAEGSAICAFTPRPKPVIKPAREARGPTVAFPLPLASHSGRTSAVLIPEIQALEKELEVLEKTDARRPALMRKLAEMYDDVADAKLNEILVAGADARTRQIAVWNAARTRAIKVLELLISSAIKFPARDEALFRLAVLYESRPVFDPASLDELRAKREDVQAARRWYFQLVREAPDSKFLPQVYLRFAEVLFDLARDGKPEMFKAAIEAYARAEAGCDGCDHSAFAAYKQGFAYWAIGDAANAKEALQTAIAVATEQRQHPRAAELIADATKALGEL
jgi:hypothetical protein